MNYEIKYTILQIYVNWFGVVNTFKQAASWFKTIHSIHIHLVTLSNTFFFYAGKYSIYKLSTVYGLSEIKEKKLFLCCLSSCLFLCLSAL